MDFKDILSYKPKHLEQVTNASNDNSNSNNSSSSASENATSSSSSSSRLISDSSAKRRHDEDDTQSKRFADEEEKARALKLLAEDKAELTEFTDVSMKKLALQLEKKVSTNQEMRIVHGDDPLKFMQSEIQLHDNILEFSTAATAPKYYGVLVKLRTHATLISLLGHQNTDIVVAAVTLLQEMTDGDTLGREAPHAVPFIDALLEEGLVAQLLRCTEHLNESNTEEAEAVHKCMGIIENVLELQPDAVKSMGAESTLIPWLIARIRKRFDANQLYASELLALLLQNSDDNRVLFGKKNGVERIAQRLAKYRKSDPVSEDEAEFMENLFDVLCSAILVDANKDLFMEIEGVELMVLLLRERMLSRFGALRTLDFILSDEKHAPAAARIVVENLGLGALFPFFMKLPKLKKHPSLKGQEKKYEEHIVSVIASLVRELSSDKELFDRILPKFVEKNFLKCVKLAELHATYEASVRACEKELSQEREAALADGEEIDDAYEDDEYLERLEAGLTVLQQVDFIAVEIMVACGNEMVHEMRKLFKMKGAKFTTIAAVLEEYANNIDDEDKGERSLARRVRQANRTVFPKLRELDTEANKPTAESEPSAEKATADAGSRKRKGEDTGNANDDKDTDGVEEKGDDS